MGHTREDTGTCNLWLHHTKIGRGKLEIDTWRSKDSLNHKVLVKVFKQHLQLRFFNKSFVNFYLKVAQGKYHWLKNCCLKNPVMWSNDQEKNFIENVKDDFFPPKIHSPVWLSVLFISWTHSSSAADLKCPPDFSTQLQKNPSSLAESCILKVNRSSGLPNMLNQKAPCTYFTTRQFAKSGSALAVKTVKPCKTVKPAGFFTLTSHQELHYTRIPPFIAAIFPSPCTHCMCFVQNTHQILQFVAALMLLVLFGEKQMVLKLPVETYAFCRLHIQWPNRAICKFQIKAEKCFKPNAFYSFQQLTWIKRPEILMMSLPTGVCSFSKLFIKNHSLEAF